MGNTLRDDRPLLFSGPRDGARIARGPRPNFIFVGGGSERPRVFVEPGPGRDLYRYSGRDNGIARFIFAGHTHRKCEGCGAFVRAKPSCALCGHAPVDAAPR